MLLKLNGHDRLAGRRGLDTDELVEIARWLEADGADAVEVSNGHYESGFPMMAGTFDGFYRALAVHGIGQYMSAFRRGSMRYAGGAVRRDVAAAVARAGGLQPRLRAALQGGAADSGDLRRRLPHAHRDRAGARVGRRGRGLVRPRVHRRPVARRAPAHAAWPGRAATTATCAWPARAPGPSTASTRSCARRRRSCARRSAREQGGMR